MSSISPASETIAPGTVTFSASSNGGTTNAITWSASGGTITAGGGRGHAKGHRLALAGWLGGNGRADLDRSSRRCGVAGSIARNHGVIAGIARRTVSESVCRVGSPRDCGAIQIPR
jgi:hypothetical protein